MHSGDGDAEKRLILVSAILRHTQALATKHAGVLAFTGRANLGNGNFAAAEVIAVFGAADIGRAFDSELRLKLTRIEPLEAELPPYLFTNPLPVPRRAIRIIPSGQQLTPRPAARNQIGVGTVPSDHLRGLKTGLRDLGTTLAVPFNGLLTDPQQ